MADIVITAANVAPGAGALFHEGVAGEAIDPGEECYVDEADGNKIKLADANVSSATARVRGLAVNQSVAAGQRATLQTHGTVTLGVTVPAITVGATYWLSAAAGKISNSAPASGSRNSVTGVGVAGGIKLALFNSDQLVP